MWQSGTPTGHPARIGDRVHVCRQEACPGVVAAMDVAGTARKDETGVGSLHGSRW
jgi:hypothetical protein